MRIKYEKGITPEVMAEHFVSFIRNNDIVMGSVNVYVQTYDDEMKAVKTSRNDEYLLVRPGDVEKSNYYNDVARTRRKKMKAV